MDKFSVLIRGLLVTIILTISFPPLHIEAVSPDPEVVSSEMLASAPLGGSYRLDAARSRFLVKVFVGGFLSGFAHDHVISIRDFSGEARLTPGTLQPASFQMTIKADSLSLTDKVSASDKQEIEQKMRQKVLETSRYPDIVFKSTKIDLDKIAEGQYRAKIFGNLTLHGVTQSGFISATLTQEGNNLRAHGDFPLKQSDYNIEQVTAAAGTIKVKDELKFSFDIVASGQ